jgi:hypothetical protein
MERRVRFGTYLQESRVLQRRVKYSEVVALQAEEGAAAGDRSQLALRPKDVARLVRPYVTVRFVEQLKAVVPLALYLLLFQLFVLHQPVRDAGIIAGGLLAVIVGLMLFLEGLKVGLMPLGETIGTVLPRRSSLPVVLTIAFILGIGVTFAEPAIGALQAAGALVDVTKAPYLYTLLSDWSGALVLVVGMGVGLATVLGTIRFLRGWSLKPLIFASVIPALFLSVYVATDEQLARTLALAWDCGAVTTGPVTVPLVLALGIGIASAGGKGSSSLSGFGIVTLASIFPVVGVMGLAMFVSATVSPDEIIRNAAAAAATTSHAWHEKTPWVEIIMGTRAIVPLVLFLLAVLYLVLRERIRDRVQSAYGLALALSGMIVFNLGLSYGLGQLGAQTGRTVPAAFAPLGAVEGSPLYPVLVGLGVAILFAWVLGFGATLAEPALNALGITVENLTNGAFRKSMLMYAVSTGVAFGIALGVAKIVFGFSIMWVLVPGYLAALALTAFSSEAYVNVAWDSAGVTTGPVTVPLVLAMGLGFGETVGAIEGFGILSFASIGPIVSVLIVGLAVQRNIRKRHEIEDREIAEMEAAG